MNKPGIPEICRVAIALFFALLPCGSVSAQPLTISAVPKNEGPVGIADLHVLLDSGMQFQIFDFDANEKVCLVLGYVHEVNGVQSDRSERNAVLCNLAGPHRLIAVMRPAGDTRHLLFSLHDRRTGAGSTMTVAELPIGTDVTGAATFMAEETINSAGETTLFRWRFGSNPPHPDPRHDVRILARLDENAGGISSYSKPNDFGQ